MPVKTQATKPVKHKFVVALSIETSEKVSKKAVKEAILYGVAEQAIDLPTAENGVIYPMRVRVRSVDLD